MGFFKREPTENVVKKILNEFKDTEDVKNIVEEYLELNNTPFYEKLVFIDMNNLNAEDIQIDRSKDFSVQEKLASKNMSTFPLRLPFANMLSFQDFYVTYGFIAAIYHLYTNQKISTEIYEKIFYGKLATRILFLLEKFDSDTPTPEPTAEFFKKLGKVKWEKSDKRLAYLLENLLYVRLTNKWEENTSSFGVSEEAFIRVLMGCSAVLNGRNRIQTKDIIRGHKTYLKLIDTDVSKLL